MQAIAGFSFVPGRDESQIHYLGPAVLVYYVEGIGRAGLAAGNIRVSFFTRSI